ncbi:MULTISPECIES: FecCD family ABC transporter permease [Micrococcaceae]|uniref:FecCD family ABC transporter permease n=1 Tax=unclassified Kocuria TaxID=2649579 RepID=UPI001011441D|nr:MULTISPECIES: iron chelate uptake ABC transporter family permease subunit [unclassified Kocuria]
MILRATSRRGDSPYANAAAGSEKGRYLGGALVPSAPRGYWWFRAGTRLSVLVERRVLIVGCLLAVVTVVLGLFAVGLGGSSVGFEQVFRIFIGEGRASARFVVFELRIPRIVLAIVVGSALGTAGAVFQVLTRNPLGSPDLIGFTMGAQTGILVSVVLFGGTLVPVPIAALIGGLVAGTAIWMFSFRGGFGGLRLILAGIAISSMLGSLNRWLILRTDSDTAFGAITSVIGSLAGAGWERIIAVGPATLLIQALVLAMFREVQVLDLGEDLAVCLGTRVDRAQILLVLLGTALVALATTAAGPISFVALVAPHLTRMLCRTATASLMVSALFGAFLLLAADVLSQSMLDSMPVGIVTSAVGGIYFMGLLLTEARKRQ